MSKSKPGLVKIGIFSLALRLIGSPISFLFSLVVARYLSAISVETFGAWQFIFVLVTGYFTIPGDLLSNITSRYTAEGKPVGGILFIDMITAVISSVIYVVLVPYFVSISHYDEPIYFYLGVLLIFTIFFMKASNAISLGRGPRVNAIAALTFQLIRLMVAVYGLLILRLSIEAVILAYMLGYIAQIGINMFFVKANFRRDLHVAFMALRKSVIFMIPYIQYILEATLTWVAVFLVRNTVPVSYFESALIISNLVIWSTGAFSGLIPKLSETKDPSVIETSLKLFSLASSLFLLLALADGLPLLYLLRPEYVAAYISLIILSISNLLRGFFQIFYTSVYMNDQTLSVESREELKGHLARLAKRNSALSVIGTGIAIGLMGFLYLSHVTDPAIYSASMSLGLLINSVAILVSAFQSSKELYNFHFPLPEVSVPVASSLVIGLFFMFYPILPIHGSRFIQDVYIMAERAGLALIPFIVVNLALNKYSRQIVSGAIGIIKPVLSSTRNR
ncbi:hypothetical protein ACI49J_10535 [Metallosphaera sp. D4-4]|uniref:hypothetical protein n=1 Tax=Metallosphaera sp. D4-4 TaxID=3379815 RepID=UPI003908A44D